MTDCIWLDLLGVFAIALGIATMMGGRGVGAPVTSSLVGGARHWGWTGH